MHEHPAQHGASSRCMCRAAPAWPSSSLPPAHPASRPSMPGPLCLSPVSRATPGRCNERLHVNPSRRSTAPPPLPPARNTNSHAQPSQVSPSPARRLAVNQRETRAQQSSTTALSAPSLRDITSSVNGGRAPPELAGARADDRIRRSLRAAPHELHGYGPILCRLSAGSGWMGWVPQRVDSPLTGGPPSPSQRGPS